MRESAWLLPPPLVLAALSLGLGVAIPAALNRNLQQAAANVLGAEPAACRLPRAEARSHTRATSHTATHERVTNRCSARSRNTATASRTREASIPRVPLEALASTVVDACRKGARLVLWFGRKVESGVRVYAVVADDAEGLLGLLAADAREGASYPAMTPAIPQANRPERELFEQMGIKPRRAPLAQADPLPGAEGGAWQRSRSGPPRCGTIPGDYAFLRMEGLPVHEVGVGPIHAGIIGPGHFRFQCQGETIEHLEIQLGYEHRGAEELIPRVKPSRVPVIVETIAGDTSIAYATAYSEMFESLGGCSISPRAEAIRGIALEVERLANHVGDLGALAADIGFWPSSAYFGRIRGEFLNTAMEMGGNRYGRHFVRPGGTTRDLGAGPRRPAAEADAAGEGRPQALPGAGVRGRVGHQPVRVDRADQPPAGDRLRLRRADCAGHGPGDRRPQRPPDRHLAVRASSRSPSATTAPCSTAPWCAGSRSSARSTS